MSKIDDQTKLSYREKMLLKVLFLIAKVICGKCFDGGLASDLAKTVESLEAEIMIGTVVISERKVTA